MFLFSIANIKKTRLYRHIYDFSVDYVNYVNYLVKKQDIKQCLD